MEVSESNFEQEVLKSDKPVIVDYSAEWCGPCKMIAPIFEKLSHQITNVKFVKINVDSNQNLASSQGVMGIPCMIVYKNGEEVDRIVGFQDEATLKKKLTTILG